MRAARSVMSCRIRCGLEEWCGGLQVPGREVGRRRRGPPAARRGRARSAGHARQAQSCPPPRPPVASKRGLPGREGDEVDRVVRDGAPEFTASARSSRPASRPCRRTVRVATATINRCMDLGRKYHRTAPARAVKSGGGGAARQAPARTRAISRCCIRRVGSRTLGKQVDSCRGKPHSSHRQHRQPP